MRQVLALCEMCNNPIFRPDDICRVLNEAGEKIIVCPKCDAYRNMLSSFEDLEYIKRLKKISYILAAVAMLLGIAGGIVITCFFREFWWSIPVLGCGAFFFTFCVSSKSTIVYNTLYGMLKPLIGNKDDENKSRIVYVYNGTSGYLGLAVIILVLIIAVMLVVFVFTAAVLALFIAPFAFPFAVIFLQRDIRSANEEYEYWSSKFYEFTTEKRRVALRVPRMGVKSTE